MSRYREKPRPKPGRATCAVIRAQRRHLVAFALLLVFAIAALPAFAQQQGSAQNAPVLPPYPYGYDHMMGAGREWGWHPGLMIAGTVVVGLAIIGIMAIFVWLVRWAVHGFPFYRHGHQFLHGSSAFDILEERFAKGEIDEAEFEDKRKTIGRWPETMRPAVHLATYATRAGKKERPDRSRGE